MSIESKLFARIQGETITQYSLTNKNSMAVRLLTFGARVQQLRLPNAAGLDPNLIVGFVSLEDYLKQPEPYGALLGPDCDQRQRTDWQNWNWEAAVANDALTLALTLPEAADGHPGTQKLTITHSLDDDNRWTQHLHVESDAPLLIRPAQDLAFMLTGDPARTVAHQELTIAGQTTAPTTRLTEATEATLVDADWRLQLATDAAGLAVSTFDHIDTTTNFNGILGHPAATVGLRPLVSTADQPIMVDEAQPYDQVTTITLQSTAN